MKRDNSSLMELAISYQKTDKKEEIMILGDDLLKKILVSGLECKGFKKVFSKEYVKDSMVVEIFEDDSQVVFSFHDEEDGLTAHICEKGDSSCFERMLLLEGLIEGTSKDPFQTFIGNIYKEVIDKINSYMRVDLAEQPYQCRLSISPGWVTSYK